MSTHPAAYSLFQQPITTPGYYTTPYDFFRNYSYSPVASNNVAAPAPVQPPATTFRAPAHKNSHHLHSIPPREKSTRTLIVDHMLWVHGRTRLAQARAELGMTDLTGGPSSANYAHRTRPENYEEEDEVSSEGEDSVAVLRSHSNASEEELRRRQDLPLARTLRLRAEGLEKVVTSMLGQPPPVLQHLDAHSHHHHQYQETSPRTRTGRHPHILPNGVRLRLALGTIINDFFARQAPHPPYRHTHPPTRATSPSPMISTSADLPDALLPLAGISGASVDYPDNTPSPELLPLDGSMLPDDAYLATAYSHAYGYGYSSNFQDYSGMFHQYPPPASPTKKRKREERYGTTKKRPKPSSKVLSLYASGCTDANDASSGSDENATICPRHLKLGCEICVEARSTPISSSSSGPSSSFGSWLNRSPGTVGVGVGVGAGSGRASMTIPTSSSGTSIISGTGSSNGGISGWKEGIGIGAGLLKPDVAEGSVLRRKVVLSHHHSSRSSSRSKHQATDEEEEEHPCTGSGNTKLSKILPRFIKLSALVAGELGREVRGEEPESDEADSSGSEGEEERGNEEGDEDRDGDRTPRPGDLNVKREREETPRPVMQPPPVPSTIPGPSTTTSTAPLPPLSSSHSRPTRTQAAAAHEKMYHNALKPTSEWYFILAGLLTRAVLEGYLTAGWLGVGGLECLMNIGTVDESDPLHSQFFRSFARRRERGRRRKRAGDSEGDEEDGVEGSYSEDEDEDEIRDEDDELFEEVEPDEYPTLKEALKVLFPSLRAGSSSTSSESAKAKDRRTAEEEYTDEMRLRLGKFYDVSTTPPSTSSAISRGLPTSTEGVSGGATTLTAHMERLAKEYPAEPVERAAVRFCEAIAKWRGCPELEMYKTNKRKKPHAPVAASTSTAPTQFTTSTTAPAGGAGGTMMMSMESLVHSNPTSPLLANTTTNPASSNLSSYASGDASRARRKRPEIGDYFTTSAFSTSSFTTPAGSSSSTLNSNAGSNTFSTTSAVSAGGARGVTQGFGAWITQGASTLSAGSTTTATTPPSGLSGSTMVGVKRQREGADDHGVGAKRVHV